MHFQSGLLSVDASGEFSLEDAKQAFLELLKAIAQYQAEKILFDGRNVKGKPGTWSASTTANSQREKLTGLSLSTKFCRGLRMLCMSLFVTRQD